jgi:hypothetical protein
MKKIFRNISKCNFFKKLSFSLWKDAKANLFCLSAFGKRSSKEEERREENVKDIKENFKETKESVPEVKVDQCYEESRGKHG